MTDQNGETTSNAWDYQVTPPLETLKLLGPSGLLEPTEQAEAHRTIGEVLGTALPV